MKFGHVRWDGDFGLGGSVLRMWLWDWDYKTIIRYNLKIPGLKIKVNIYNWGSFIKTWYDHIY